MPKYYINQHLLSANARTIIKDDMGKAAFLLVGRWGTRGDVLSVYDMQGSILASIRQTSFALESRFDLFKEYEKVGSLSRILSINRDYYYIKGLKWAAVGDIKHRRYRIHQFNDVIMTMQPALTCYGDFFECDIRSEEEAPLCICIAAILDYWVKRPKKEKNPFRNKRVDLEFS
ncbi:LURP-one-related/scramblase family protein [Vagococcus acidifermentans]|uniref:YxjI n=1 Tax=Vagococcus acidifermentans TaxID=564710 RepID=A0A430AUL1_9ENTE|nr:hypothetical protein [Vagococcus acidifermentans]RSU11748.1 hypothetical protein CBF27_07250 [Vagococcus acidifermentans]